MAFVLQAMREALRLWRTHNPDAATFRARCIVADHDMPATYLLLPDY